MKARGVWKEVWKGYIIEYIIEYKGMERVWAWGFGDNGHGKWAWGYKHGSMEVIMSMGVCGPMGMWVSTRVYG